MHSAYKKWILNSYDKINSDYIELDKLDQLDKLNELDVLKKEVMQIENNRITGKANEQEITNTNKNNNNFN